MTELECAVMWDKLAGSKPSEGQQLDSPFAKLSLDLIKEEVGEILEAYDKGDIVEVVDGLGDSLKVVSQMCFALSINPETLLAEINNSNFSKFCLNEEDAKESVDKYEDDVRYKDVHYVEVDGHYVIKGWKVEHDKDVFPPKILKGIHFVEPDIQKFIIN